MAESRALKVWFILIFLTIVSYGFAHMGYTGQVLVAIVLAGAWIKGQLIIDYFMGLKHVRMLWRVIVSAWLLIVLLAIGGMYFTYG
ncbi:MAG: cytochrome C oxidase subunit IV family protein [Gammaproteobacteria bacterium]|nr:cytochrome C oxidase subunit IV family protein [Gammaproteobacteria bacterium]